MTAYAPPSIDPRSWTLLSDIDREADEACRRDLESALLPEERVYLLGEKPGGTINRVTFGPTAWQFINCDDAEVLVLYGPRRESKACHPDTPVLTPNGWVKIGDLAVGDRVIAGDGSVTRVAGVYPQPLQLLWRLHFSDGASVVVTDDHLWQVETYWDRPGGRANDRRIRSASGVRRRRRPTRGPLKIVTTREIRQRLDAGCWKHGGRWSIPLVGPVQFPRAPVPLDPYLLGVLLGDGGLTQAGVHLTSADPELVEECSRWLPPGTECRAGSAPYAYRIIGTRREASHVVNPVLNAIRSLGLRGCGSSQKFVPCAYLWNDVATRHALLQGLLDTDGTISRHSNSVSYTTTSEQLAADVVFLVQSLGGLAPVRQRVPTYCYRGEQRIGKMSYHVSIRLPNGVAPFRLRRKAALVRPKGRINRVARYIVRCEFVQTNSAVCIAVDHPSRLYVVNDFIVTHNTMAGISRLLRLAQTYPKVRPIRAAIVRDTHVNLKRTVIQNIYEGAARGWWDADFRDQETECWLNGNEVHVLLMGMERPADATRFQGLGLGVVIIEEPAPAADMTSGVPVEVFAMAVTSLSQPGLPPSVALITNPPDEDHWLVQLVDALISRADPKMRVKTFWVPPGENRHVSQAYRDRMRIGLEVANRGDLVRRLAEGKLGSVKVGEPVTPEFNEERHVAKEALEVRRNFPTFRSFDLWHSPCCTWAQQTPLGYLHVLGCIQGENMGVEELIATHIIPWERQYGLTTPRSADPFSGGPLTSGTRARPIRTIIDPSGKAGDQSSTERSAAKVIEKMLGTTCEYGPVAWSARRDSVKALLARSIRGRAQVSIDPEALPLIRALRGGWRYPKTSAGQIGKLPIKDLSSHPGDSLGYLAAVLYPVEEQVRAAIRTPVPTVMEHVIRARSFLGV